MKPIIVHAEAAEDGRNAAKHYEDEKTGLGVEFRVAVENAFKRIQTQPRLYPPARLGFRRFILERFPYTIIYKEFADQIWVFAISHHRRRPNYWISRRPTDQ